MPFNKTIKKVLVIGSGPIVIGQAAEFDYAGTQACLALKEEGIEVVLVNNNPATIMTDVDIADKVYMEPLTVECLEKIIEKEQPDGIIGTLGGQTALNLIVALSGTDILKKHNVSVLGTSVHSIQQGEDRELFRKLMMELKEPVPESQIVHSLREGFEFVKKIGYPLIIRPAYTLGGEGGGFAYNDNEFETILKNGLSLSPIGQVLVERSIKGWKEVEYEVMRDDNDTCIIVCNMENFDPVGVHTGDSIVVAPSQTLTDRQYQLLRNASLKIIRNLKIVGGCNIQFAMDPQSDNYYIIEVNPRVSRSSALASKATGYPIARMAAKCAVGYHLDEIKNPITGSTFASFEPALDYVVVKLPRFPFDKFPEADATLSTQMKATGEVLAIDRTFEGALNKGLRSLEMKVNGITHPLMENMNEAQWMGLVKEPTHLRLFAITHAFRQCVSLESIHEVTSVDKWFLHKLQQMVILEQVLSTNSLDTLSLETLKIAKRHNISNDRLCALLGCNHEELAFLMKDHNIFPSYKLVDTCAAEFEAITPYYYSTYNGGDEVEVSQNNKALIIGSGPIRIGQGIEFDYCSVHAVKALKKAGYETIVVNNNPETVSTDFSVADKLYFEPITVEDILPIIQKEKIDLVFVQFGGQTALNLAEGLKSFGVNIAGTSIESIDKLEDRSHFYSLLESVGIPHIEGMMVDHHNQLQAAANTIGYPVLVRPSYVIGGQSMYTLFNEKELNQFRQTHQNNDTIWPLLVDRYVPGLECELDVISDGDNIYIPAIVEHIEKAGIHSGDSLAVLPPISLAEHVKERLTEYTRKICKAAKIIGMANIQFVLSGDIIYCLEVNPRASRTVPIVSKVTNVPMIELAIRVQLGEKLSQIGLKENPDFWTVKAPVFSDSKLKDVDHVLGPEMKSTGEIVGLGMTLEEAMSKALFLGKKSPFSLMQEEKMIFCSIADREKTYALPLMLELVNKGFSIIATKGTADFLKENNIKVRTILQKEIDITLKTEKFTAAIIIPTIGRDQLRNGAKYRALCTMNGIKTFTCLETAQQAIMLNDTIQQNYQTIKDYINNQKSEVEYLCKVY
ncbi:carbamoyl-phosphate synthase (glutamine-hydrolyzing) large subunit [Bacillus sp. CHD6a]|uniref:carbamoyl-phosphate synthase (glutamine-hydrolyzing) large subunit n=1 Tax=Bacillus sp. CHD6a TaxID=1643452 RepID=UPI0006CD9F66|nr:carbamoyl-phosphate synthase (glutamine-hydrolyzing) large subunit [Bacillus sp. CHD6a]KPB06461.1 carbamoyl phosphate synthase large subunit [Bacillus sp. CHD6a]